MKCQYCNSEIPEEALFCPECGRKQKKEEAHIDNEIPTEIKYKEICEKKREEHCFVPISKAHKRIPMVFKIFFIILVTLVLAIVFKRNVYDTYLKGDVVFRQVEDTLGTECIYSSNQADFTQNEVQDEYGEINKEERFALTKLTPTPPVSQDLSETEEENLEILYNMQIIYRNMIDGNYAELFKNVRTDFIEDANKKCFYQDGEIVSNIDSGKGMYVSKNDATTDWEAYVGDIENSQPDGYGVYFRCFDRADKSYYEVAKGNWTSGIANGEFEIYWSKDYFIELSAITYTGNLVNGLWHGTVNAKVDDYFDVYGENDEYGELSYYYATLQADNGTWVVLYEKDSEYVIAEDDRGWIWSFDEIEKLSGYGIEK